MKFRRRRQQRRYVPAVDCDQAVAQAQHDMLDLVQRAVTDGTMTDAQAASIAEGMGPARGSFGDWDRSRGRCHHMAPYPGCRGGCNP